MGASIQNRQAVLWNPGDRGLLYFSNSLQNLFENHFEENKSRERQGKVSAPIQFETALAERGVDADKQIDLLFNVIKN